MDISVVIPVYCCRGALCELYTRLSNTLTSITESYEIIFVNDACPQGSWEEIRRICESDKRVVGVNLSRNFGQHKAIMAGLDIAEGDAVVVMDCDLQDRPEHITKMYHKLQEGYDIVWARRVNRKDNKRVKLLSKLFYKICNLFSNEHIDPDLSNFSISRRNVLKEHLRIRERCRDYAVLQQWLGFDSAILDLESGERAAGRSSYSFKRKIQLALEILVAQSNSLLYLSVFVGVVFVLISLILIIWFVVNYYAFGDVIEGWSSLSVSIFLVGGMIMMSLGIQGLYIGRIFDETKKRPLYIVKDAINTRGGRGRNC